MPQKFTSSASVLINLFFLNLIKMFQNKILLTHCGKFLKFKSRPGALYPLRGETPLRIDCQNIFVSKPFEINGLQKTFLINRKLLEIKNNEKYMSECLDNKCWKCKEILVTKNPFCNSCGALQYPKPEVNFFELLGISQMYDVDVEELTQKFRNKQKNFHPDKFANKSKEELEIAEMYSSLLNKAYTTLKDPVARGLYLLEFQKGSLKCDVLLEQDFLVVIMDKNEEVENAESPKKLMQLLQSNNEKIEVQISLVRDSFRSNKLENAKLHLLKLNYYVNLGNKIKEKQNNLNLPKDV